MDEECVGIYARGIHKVDDRATLDKGGDALLSPANH
jgi:hypothetical protein